VGPKGLLSRPQGRQCRCLRSPYTADYVLLLPLRLAGGSDDAVQAAVTSHPSTDVFLFAASRAITGRIPASCPRLAREKARRALALRQASYVLQRELHLDGRSPPRARRAPDPRPAQVNCDRFRRAWFVMFFSFFSSPLPDEVERPAEHAGVAAGRQVLPGVAVGPRPLCPAPPISFLGTGIGPSTAPTTTAVAPDSSVSRLLARLRGRRRFLR